MTSSREATRLFEALSRHFVEKGWVTLWLATVGGKPVAFEYHLTYRGVTAPIRADFDEAYRAISPGAYLEAEIYRSVFEHPEWTSPSTTPVPIRTNTRCAGRRPRTSMSHCASPHPGGTGGSCIFLGGLRRPRMSGSTTDDLEHDQ